MACAGTMPESTIAAAGGGQLPERRGQPQQRPEQDIGEDQIERRLPSARPRAAMPSALHDLDHRAGAVEPRIGARDADRAEVDVGCEHAPVQRAGGGDGEHAAAGAEIEDAQDAARCSSALQSRSSARRQPRVVP